VKGAWLILLTVRIALTLQVVAMTLCAPESLSRRDARALDLGIAVRAALRARALPVRRVLHVRCACVHV
jgi:hypothetical protein